MCSWARASSSSFALAAASDAVVSRVNVDVLDADVATERTDPALTLPLDVDADPPDATDPACESATDGEADNDARSACAALSSGACRAARATLERREAMLWTWLCALSVEALRIDEMEEMERTEEAEGAERMDGAFELELDAALRTDGVRRRVGPPIRSGESGRLGVGLGGAGAGAGAWYE